MNLEGLSILTSGKVTVSCESTVTVKHIHSNQVRRRNPHLHLVTSGSPQKTSGSKLQTQRQVSIAFQAASSTVDGKVSAAACVGCPAGLSMTCCHVSAVLHHVTDVLGQRSPTSALCRWVAPINGNTPMAVDAVIPKIHKTGRSAPKKHVPFPVF